MLSSYGHVHDSVLYPMQEQRLPLLTEGFSIDVGSTNAESYMEI